MTRVAERARETLAVLRGASDGPHEVDLDDVGQDDAAMSGDD